jgi:ABC-2 type transport system ATP-binding protein
MAAESPVQVPVINSTPAPAQERIIDTKNLSKEFNGEFAVKDLTFYVPRGKIFGFIGPSGSGKTTTIRMLTGYYPPTGGEVLVFGRPPSKFRRSLREKMGYMPQLFVLYPHLSVWENLNFAASIYGVKLGRRSMLNEVLDFVELRKDKNKLARDISGGMQRRLSLAATLVHDPELIFLDEPTAGIDPVLRSKFWDRFRDLRNAGRTLFVTTQYVSEAAYCDLVGVMGEGRMLAVDTPERLRYRAFGGDIVDLRTVEPQDYHFEFLLRKLPFIRKITRTGENSVRLIVEEGGSAVPTLLNWLQEHNIAVEGVEEFVPPFDDVFIEIVQRGRQNA